jgi:hypothetical protein
MAVGELTVSLFGVDLGDDKAAILVQLIDSTNRSLPRSRLCDPLDPAAWRTSSRFGQPVPS